MKTINLRDYYPHCREDIPVEVSEEVLETILQAVRTEHTQERKARRWGTCYNSLDACDCLHGGPSFLPVAKDIVFFQLL